MHVTMLKFWHTWQTHVFFRSHISAMILQLWKWWDLWLLVSLCLITNCCGWEVCIFTIVLLCYISSKKCAKYWNWYITMISIVSWDTAYWATCSASCLDCFFGNIYLCHHNFCYCCYRIFLLCIILFLTLKFPRWKKLP